MAMHWMTMAQCAERRSAISITRTVVATNEHKMLFPILILSAYIHIGFPSSLFHSDFPTTPCKHLSSSAGALYALLILSSFFLSSTYYFVNCKILKSLITSSILVQNTYPVLSSLTPWTYVLLWDRPRSARIDNKRHYHSSAYFNLYILR